MAAEVDTGNSPIRFAKVCAQEDTVTSASFTPPANSLLVCCIEGDGKAGDDGTITNVPTTSGLTWVPQVERSIGEGIDGGMSSIWTAIQVTSASRTVTVTHTRANSSTDREVSCKIYVVTGADVGGTPVDSVTASNKGSSTTNNLTTTSITPGANGLLFAADCDWMAGGNNAFEASTDLTQNTTLYTDLISVCDGYKACTSGVGVTANLNAGGTAAAQHKWCQIVVRQAGAIPRNPVPMGFVVE